jgi:hypothetical protein
MKRLPDFQRKRFSRIRAFFWFLVSFWLLIFKTYFHHLRDRSGDAKLALFRQQSSIIARKKEGTASKLADLQDSVAKVQAEWEARQAGSPRAASAGQIQVSVMI